MGCGGNPFKNLESGVKHTVGDIGDGLGTIARESGRFVGNVASETTDVVGEGLRSAGGRLGGDIGDVISGVGGTVTQLGNDVDTAARGVGGGLEQMAEGYGTAGIETVGESLEELGDSKAFQAALATALTMGAAGPATAYIASTLGVSMPVASGLYASAVAKAQGADDKNVLAAGLSAGLTQGAFGNTPTANTPDTITIGDYTAPSGAVSGSATPSTLTFDGQQYASGASKLSGLEQAGYSAAKSATSNAIRQAVANDGDVNWGRVGEGALTSGISSGVGSEYGSTAGRAAGAATGLAIQESKGGPSLNSDNYQSAAGQFIPGYNLYKTIDTYNNRNDQPTQPQGGLQAYNAFKARNPGSQLTYQQFQQYRRG